MKNIKLIIGIVIFFVVLFLFSQINNLNYKKHLEIQKEYVDHPDKLPKKEFAIKTAFGFKNLKADIYWIKAIQYIGSNALASEYKKYLFNILDLITELNPYFEKPYTIGELLLASYNYRYENLNDAEQEKNINQAIEIGLKGIRNFCDMEKVELIKNEDDLNKIWNNPKYKDPCKSYSIPNYLGYIYYFNKKDPETSSQYYKIASANSNSLEGSKIMAAIMKGKGGNREKAFFMFINLAIMDSNEDEICRDFANSLYKLGIGIFNYKNIELNGNLIEKLSILREKTFGKFDNKKDESSVLKSECNNYINKSLRELNLEYIERANLKFKNDNLNNALDAYVLYNSGYIDYLPIDFQQYEEQGQGIYYFYNNEIGNFDYKMKNY